KHNLGFDEHELLSFHQYVEEFCIQARANYNVKTYALPIRCKHASYGTLNRDLDLAIDYINSKYPSIKWAGTCTHFWWMLQMAKNDSLKLVQPFQGSYPISSDTKGNLLTPKENIEMSDYPMPTAEDARTWLPKYTRWKYVPPLPNEAMMYHI